MALGTAAVSYKGSNVHYGADTVLKSMHSGVDTITATAGGTKAAAKVLTARNNRISVCATAADSVLLPAAVEGLSVFLVNSGAASAQVFGAGTDTINGVATATGVAHAAALSALYVCVADGAWFRVLSA